MRIIVGWFGVIISFLRGMWLCCIFVDYCAVLGAVMVKMHNVGMIYFGEWVNNFFVEIIVTGKQIGRAHV